MKLSELTLDRIREAYTKTGCTPGSNYNWSSRQDVCPLEAVARDIGDGSFSKTCWLDVLDKTGETIGFYEGWDGKELHLTGDPAAYEFGVAVRKELLGK